MYTAFINVGVYTKSIAIRRVHFRGNIVTIPAGIWVNAHHNAFRTTARTRRKAAQRLRLQHNKWVKELHKGPLKPKEYYI